MKAAQHPSSDSASGSLAHGGDLPAQLRPSDDFAPRHLGPSQNDERLMLKALGLSSLDELTEQAMPKDIALGRALVLPAAMSESEALSALWQRMSQNQVWRSYIGLGTHGCLTPTVIQRNVLENPGWYTQYTPYQAEIAQGRLEALLNFQTMVAELTGLPLSNASLLDEGTAAAEAMTLCQRMLDSDRAVFVVSNSVHPQTLAVLETRALPLGVVLRVCDVQTADFADAFGVLVQYPTTTGSIEDYRAVAERAHAAGALVVAATDLLALVLLTPPGEWGADIAVGSTQRFGVPMGFGGPHAAFMSARDDFRRQLPGRIVGVSKDVHGRMAYRLAFQTREQHIRRDKATSNICTAQVLLAVMASMYAVYHGPAGLARIARRVRGWTTVLRHGLVALGYDTGKAPAFDTLRIPVDDATRARIIAITDARRINLRHFADGALGVSLDETVNRADVVDLLDAFAAGRNGTADLAAALPAADAPLPAPFARTSAPLTHDIFQRYHAEHELLRYLRRLESRDLSLTTSMIPLGSCTMKLNATTEMVPVSWPQVSALHPFAPAAQTKGYSILFHELETWLAEITGFAGTSLQPNAGSQGEYAGLLTIRAYHESQGQGRRDVCLIPVSAHGTNPASAVMAGYRVVAVRCDAHGNVELDDLEAKAKEHAERLAAVMVTYPSTHGVFEDGIRRLCDAVHRHGGQVYLDGANMNAQVGLCRPGDYGADVCHLNLHKTFCIPHGGGGPGMGPICVAKHLLPFLPGHPLAAAHAGKPGPVSAAPWGSASILPISWLYIAMMGPDGLRRASQTAILAANYMAQRLEPHYGVLYRRAGGRVAHEFILDARGFKKSADISVDDIAKRLMDYGFHAPTMSWPVAGTLMLEPTESESKAELDRFVDALIGIRNEIRAIEEGRADRSDNVLRHAPHTAEHVTATEWSHAYDRDAAAYPMAWLREHKFWPHVGRIDNAYGDRHPVCTCPSVEELTGPA